MCGDGTNDVGALKQAHVGVSIISEPDLEAKQRTANETISAVKAEEKKEQKASKKHSSKKDGSKKEPKKSRAERIESSLQAIAETEDELAYVSLGNASVASPFTSRKTSIRCCKDILQQGRCTLLTMIQIYKILGVNCLVTALVLTKLHQKGVKQGDRQMTAMGLVVAGLFLFVTRGKPLPKLSARKPPSSVLCKETLISMAIQFAIHFVAIMTVTAMSDAYVDPYDPSMIPDGPFVPNTLNTATFLVTVLTTINTFVVNYRGRPFMENLYENTLLFRSLQVCYLVLFVCALDMFPPLNQLLQLSTLPSSGLPVFGEARTDGSTEFAQDLLLQAVEAIGFRIMLCVIMILDTSCVLAAESVIRRAFGA
jgi:cation-transporting ATPase 13A1